MTEIQQQIQEWIASFCYITILYAIIIIVHIICPLRIVHGYVCNPLDLWKLMKQKENENNNNPKKYQDKTTTKNHKNENNNKNNNKYDDNSGNNNNNNKMSSLSSSTDVPAKLFLLQPLLYNLNGFRCFWIIISGFCFLHYYCNVTTITLFLSHHYIQCAIISNIWGFITTYYFVYIRYNTNVLTLDEQQANKLRRSPTIIISTTNENNNNNMMTTTTTTSILKEQSLYWDERGYTFFFGKEFNPRWYISTLSSFITNTTTNTTNTVVVDVKMLLYLIGAIVLELNIISAFFYEQQRNNINEYNNNSLMNNSNALLLYTGLFTWFIVDYLWYEQIHLYTYDIFAEKIGFKLLWGCLCFYPFFYCIGIIPFISINNNNNNDNVNSMMSSLSQQQQQQQQQEKHHDLSMIAMIIIVIIYSIGSILTRGANMQKFYFRQYPNKQTITLFGGLLVLQQETVLSSKKRLLCSGFWGLSRHINYLGEIIQAIALALPSCLYYSYNYSGDDDNDNDKIDQRSFHHHHYYCCWISWLYPLYYIALFLPRQLDDEALMRQKYGDNVMDEYNQLVPYRLIPGVY